MFIMIVMGSSIRVTKESSVFIHRGVVLQFVLAVNGLLLNSLPSLVSLEGETPGCLWGTG